MLRLSIRAEIRRYFPSKSRHLSKNPSRAQTTQNDQSLYLSFVSLINQWNANQFYCIASEMLFLWVFSLTCPASMQIHWNKRKRLQKKRAQLPEDWFGTPIWPRKLSVKLLFQCQGSAQNSSLVQSNVFLFEKAFFFIRFRRPSKLIRSKTEDMCIKKDVFGNAF